ncbi:MAG: hypothetical protein Q9162_002187 [Coniocarpon cinnabarinum]
MAPSLKDAITALLAGAVTLVTAQFGCQTGPFQCSVCGFQGSAPIKCLAVNATFDDVPANQALTNYSSASWPGFTSSRPSSQATVPHLAPFSVPQTAVASSGQGTLVLGTTDYNGISRFQFQEGGLFGSVRYNDFQEAHVHQE